MIYLFLIYSISFLSTVISQESGPLVNTTFGQVQGFYYKLDNGFSANVFLGIPFATPPIGEHRFEKPSPLEKWPNVLETKSFKPGCAPYLKSNTLSPTNEDCLYLNIFAPTIKRKADDEYPILVWIPSGRFSTSGAEKYGYKSIIDNFVSRGIMVVTVQYRLGPFGFLSLSEDFNDSEVNQEKELPGNLGLYDIRAALVYLIENAEHFGGNSFNISLMGKDSGAAIIEALTISPRTDYLFQKVIELSNPTSAFQWVNPHEILKLSKGLVKYVGCDELNTTKEIKECMKIVPIEKIYDGQEYLSTSYSNYPIYGPMLNSDFFYGRFQPTKQYKKYSLTGFSNMDFVIEHLISKSPELLASKGRNRTALTEFFDEYNEDKLLEALFYMEQFNEKYTDETKLSYDKNYGSYSTDVKAVIDRNCFQKWFSENILWNIKTRADWHWPVYFFYLNSTNVFDMSYDDLEKGQIHADDLAYLFGVYTFGKFEVNNNDRILQKILVDAIVNFVKNKSPSSEYFEWPLFDMKEPEKCVHLGQRMMTRNSIVEDLTYVWTKEQEQVMEKAGQKFEGRFAEEL